VSRQQGGYVGFNRVPAASAINSAASGVWTVREAETLKRAGTWPSVPTVPGTPTSLASSGGDAQASLTWTAPADNGGTAITDYAVQFSSNGGSTWNTFLDGTSTATSLTVTGLTNGTAYVFRVAAVNAVGAGSYTAASSSVTPAPGPSLTKLSNGTVATFTGSGTVSDPFVAASYIAGYSQAARFQINGSGTVYVKYNATLDGDDDVRGTWWKDDGTARLRDFSGSSLAGTDKILSLSIAAGTQFRFALDSAGTFTNVRIWVQ